MKYYVTSIKDTGDEFVTIVTEDSAEAIKEAREEWDFLTKYDQGHTTIEVRAYVEDIEDEACTCFDYDTVEWKENGNERH